MCGVPQDSPIIQIAWGHDLLEDTKVTGKEIIEVSDESVYRAICMLTKPERVSKSLYLRAIARKGLREVILVKAADRICNTKDFVKLEGELSAYRYLHQAEVLLPALEKIGKAYQEIISAQDCLTLKELAINGKDLMTMGIPAGKEIGRILNDCLEWVLDEPERNCREALVTHVNALVSDK